MSKNKNINTKVIIEELHRAFKLFNENLFESQLPEPAILIQSRGNKKLCLGWCTVQKVWKNDVTQEEKYEINLVAEALNRGVYPVMATLLHEMVHLHNLVMEIKDVSRGGTYHNTKFKKTAEAHGLLCEHDTRIGWSLTKLQGLTMDLIDSAGFDKAVFSMGRKDIDFEGAGEKRKKKKSSVRKYVCPKCGCIIRASKEVNVICGDCYEHQHLLVKFVEEKEPETDENGNPAITVPPTEYTPVDEEPIEDAFTVEYVCLDCGSVNFLPEGAEVCPDCGGKVVEPSELTGTDEPEQTEEVQEPAVIPVEIVEIDTQLNDGAGNMVDVKQGFINTPQNTGWDIDRITDTLIKIAKEGAEKGLEIAFPDAIPVEINPKMISQWASYKEGKHFTFSKSYIEEASDDEIIETIKHIYVHHYMFKVFGEKVGHKKNFKEVCEQLGADHTTPLKNHRAMR